MNNFACLVRIVGGDLYIGEDLSDVNRASAPIEKYDAAVARAKRRFGHDWQNHAQIVEATTSEWQTQVARLGGQTVTQKKKDHLREISNNYWSRINYFTGVHQGVHYGVAAKSLNEAAALFREHNIGINYWFIYRNFRRWVRPKSGMRMGVPGVYTKTGTQKYKRLT